MRHNIILVTTLMISLHHLKILTFHKTMVITMGINWMASIPLRTINMSIMLVINFQWRMRWIFIVTIHISHKRGMHYCCLRMLLLYGIINALRQQITRLGQSLGSSFPQVLYIYNNCKLSGEMYHFGFWTLTKCKPLWTCLQLWIFDKEQPCLHSQWH